MPRPHTERESTTVGPAASLSSVPRQDRNSSGRGRNGGSGNRSRARPAEKAATELLRDLVLAAVAERGFAATWIAGPEGLVSVAPAAAAMLGLAAGDAGL